MKLLRGPSALPTALALLGFTAFGLAMVAGFGPLPIQKRFQMAIEWTGVVGALTGVLGALLAVLVSIRRK